MAKQEVAITISTNTEQAQTSVKSFKAQLREANGELVSMSEKFGAASTEAINAAKKVAGLKDAIGDAKALAETFNPDKKFVALGGAIQGAVSGFSALQGASALFGGESKDLEKTLVKVQSAMALQQGISGIFNSIDSFKLLANTIKTNVVTSLTTLRGALIATGLGALAVGVGLLIANFDKVKQVIMNLIPGLASVGKFFGGIIDRITDFIGVTSDATRAMDAMIASSEKSLKLNKKYLQEQGDLVDKYTKAKIDAVNAYNEAIKEEGANEVALRKRMNREILAADKERADDAAKAKEEADKKAAEKQKQIDDKAKADLKAQRDALRNIINKIQTQVENDLDKTEAQKLDRQRQRDIKELDAIKLSAKEKAEALASINKFYQKKADDLEAENKKQKEKEELERQEKNMKFFGAMADRTIAATINSAEKTKATNEKTANDEQLILDARLTAQTQFANAIGGVLSGLTQLFGAGTAAGKVAAIAEIALGTATGFVNGLDIAQKSAKGTGPAAAFAFPIFYATQIGAVLAAVGKAKQALSQVQGGAGSGVSVAAPTIPQAPMLPQASSTTINQGQVNQIGNVAARAFVVESDVSGQQERIRRLNRAARIN
jgi:hypothetical protein